MNEREFMKEAIELSCRSVLRGGGPFGAVIVRDGNIIARGSNSVTLTNDPTAHAEISAIRTACASLGVFKLDGCDLYTSCEPCPMCLSAAYWAGISRIFYGNTKEDAAAAGFDDSFIYEEIALDPAERKIPAVELMRNEALSGFSMWKEKEDRVEY